LTTIANFTGKCIFEIFLQKQKNHLSYNALELIIEKKALLSVELKILALRYFIEFYQHVHKISIWGSMLKSRFSQSETGCNRSYIMLAGWCLVRYNFVRAVGMRACEYAIKSQQALGNTTSVTSPRPIVLFALLLANMLATKEAPALLKWCIFKFLTNNDSLSEIKIAIVIIALQLIGECWEIFYRD
jgi:hypothetical protein